MIFAGFNRLLLLHSVTDIIDTSVIDYRLPADPTLPGTSYGLLRFAYSVVPM